MRSTPRRKGSAMNHTIPEDLATGKERGDACVFFGK
jgi:hypothetical protein